MRYIDLYTPHEWQKFVRQCQKHYRENGLPAKDIKALAKLSPEAAGKQARRRYERSARGLLRCRLYRIRRRYAEHLARLNLRKRLGDISGARRALRYMVLYLRTLTTFYDGVLNFYAMLFSFY